MKGRLVDSYSYGFFDTCWRGFFTLLGFLIFQFLSVVLLITLGDAILGELEDPSAILPLLIAVPVCGVVSLGLLISMPKVRVYEGGLEVQILPFWWAFVPWNDILGIATRPNPMGRICAVLVRELTLAHLLVGIIYGGYRLKPGFLILSSIDRYHDLIRIIRSRTGLEG
jgi:hypothetical protein